MGTNKFEILTWVSSVLCLVCVSLEFDPADNYLIDCGSPRNISVGNRVFMADDSLNPGFLSTSQHILANTSSSSSFLSSTFASDLYTTARVLKGTSTYTFSIRKQGRHWIRLYFFPFVYQIYNLSEAEFSVSAQNSNLLRSSQLGSGRPMVKEYSLNITSDKLVLSFSPSADSFAYLNALEVVSAPDELIPHSVGTIDPRGNNQNLQDHALETVFRVNMGNKTVYPQNDTLSRLWISDGPFLKLNSLVMFVSKAAVSYTNHGSTPDIAPPSVYGTASVLNSKSDPSTNANLTWLFNVDPGFEYLIRFHFCDINSSIPGQLLFDVYINSWSVARNLDLSNQTSNNNILDVPYYIDVVMRESNNNMLSVSVGPSDLDTFYPCAILNGLEVMKISSSTGSLDEPESDIQSLRPGSKENFGIIVAASATAGCVFVFFLLSSFVFLGRRRRRKLARVTTNGGGSRLPPTSKDGYLFPLAAIQLATGNFSENLVIGVGGFGKVYKGVLRDGTSVAVKRGNSHSPQNVAEFKTEIGMLLQFRHRHLVSFIGYCDEQNEMIIVYEYMENGTLKNHLYGSDHDLPGLSWKQRLEICIGSARGLHYLHTGSATPIIHRDVKSANILLDKNCMAKVADFGLSKVVPEIDESHVSTAVKGSFGYLDPEYLTSQQLTEKSDVYSFGVVLLEVLCGRPVFDPSLPKRMMYLVEWAMKWQKKGELDKIIDPSLVDQIRPESLMKFGETIEKCLAEHGIHRPTMGEVLWSLEHSLQLQADHGNYGELQLPLESQAIDSTGEFSVGSARDLVGISMSQVFSQMMRGDVQ
ncbi:hypothetical protein Dimus_021136 [Dionaea muscipula]